MDKIIYNFKIEMNKEDAKYFEDGEHSVSIYSNGPGKIAYCFREIKPSDEIDCEALEWIREEQRGNVSDVYDQKDGCNIHTA